MTNKALIQKSKVYRTATDVDNEVVYRERYFGHTVFFTAQPFDKDEEERISSKGMRQRMNDILRRQNGI